MPGRKRKPDHLKVVAGTDRPSRMNPDAPIPDASGAVPPDWLSPRATEIFEKLSARLGRMGVGTSTDEEMLALCATRLEEVEICTAIMEDMGKLFTSAIKYGRAKKGERRPVIQQQLKSNPIVGQRSEAIRSAQSLLAEFGLSPSTRSKVSAGKAGTAGNPFDALDF